MGALVGIRLGQVPVGATKTFAGLGRFLLWNSHEHSLFSKGKYKGESEGSSGLKVVQSSPSGVNVFFFAITRLLVQVDAASGT